MEKPSEMYTQQGPDPMDVGWDWNSPQAKPRAQSRLKRRPPTTPSSPKIPMKRHPSREYFDRIGEELRALREDMARPEDEDSLRVSPMQEEEFKNFEGFEDSFEPFEDDLFDDGLDRQLLECTKRIEDELEATSKEPQGPDATFDDMIRKLDTKKIDREKVFKFKSDGCGGGAGKSNLHKTQSFDESIGMLTKNAMDEIDRKKKEALAKLESKKKTNTAACKPPSIPTDSFVSAPLSVSPEEIEKKRLQALAKREAKRQEDIIERKRQEALKRLESNRMRNLKPLASRLN